MSGKRAHHPACACLTGERLHKCIASSASRKCYKAVTCHSVVWKNIRSVRCRFGIQFGKYPLPLAAKVAA